MHEEDQERLGPTANGKSSPGTQQPRRSPGSPAMDCAECEAAMADALDGQLGAGEMVERFQAHVSACAGCRSIFHEVEEGLGWMKSLDEVEPPSEMVHRILVATIGSAPMPVPAAKRSWLDRLRELPWLQPVFGTVLEPRFAMSFGMAFFSVMLILSMLGIRLAGVRHIDLRLAAVTRTYYETEGKVVKYYENIRFVVELESRVRDLKRVAAPEEGPTPGHEKGRDKNENRDTSRDRESAPQQQFAVVAGLEHRGERP
jgi:hypothetical protein